MQGREDPEALRHLLPLEGYERVGHPGTTPLDAEGALADYALALIVPELQVDAAAVDVERRSEILVRHRVALHMPAGATVAPRARPRRLVSLRSLPEGEVERIFLRACGGGPLDDDVFEPLVRQNPKRVLRLPRPEVDLPVHRIRVTAVDQTGDQGRDLRNVLAHLRHVIRPSHVQGAHVVQERIDVILRVREGGLPGLFRPSDDDLLDVREVLDVRDAMAQKLEIPARRVEIDVRPGVAEVAVIVRRRAADVHLDDAGSERCKRCLLPGAGVVQSKDHEVASAATGAALLSPLPAGSKTVARATRTRASKPISCAGICHRPAGPIDQRKIAAFARRKPWVQIPLGPLPPAAESR